MARKNKRPYGTGYLKKANGKWTIRWREAEIAEDGSRRKILRYETLEAGLSKKEAERILADRLAAARNGKPNQSKKFFKTLAAEWKANVLPMYKHSTRKNHKHILEKHLIPRFGDFPLTEIGVQDVQAYMAHLERRGYAPKTIDHIHDVLSAVLRVGVNWGHLANNPARNVDLPRLVTVRPKWALTHQQGVDLLSRLPLMPKTMVALALLTGLRRCELFALRWKCLDRAKPSLKITESVYEGKFDTPKTEGSVREIPLSPAALQLLDEWRGRAKDRRPDALVFSTRSGKPISPNNILRRFVFPVCEDLGLPRSTWLTFRRTYSSWAHDMGVPHKVLAQLMGHTNVNTTLNVYTQVMEDSLKSAVNKIGRELFSFVQSAEGSEELTH